MALSILFFALVSLVAATAPGIYLSIFGNDGSDGLTIATAVKSLSRAFAVMQAQKYGVIYAQPGSYPMQSLSIAGSFAIIGSQNQPGLTKFSCQGSQGTISSNGNADMTFDSISFEGCSNAIFVGSSYSTYTYTLNLYNVLFNQNTYDVRLNTGNTRLNVANTIFSNGGNSAISIYRDNSQSASLDLQIVNSKFTNYNNNYFAVQLDAGTYSSSLKVNLNMTSVTFSSASGQYLNAPGYANVVATAVTFDGSNNKNCGVAFYGAQQATLTKVVFSNKQGGPALCVTQGATVTTIGSEFSNNNITVLNNIGGAVFVQNAVYATSNSMYRSNTQNAGEGAGIHCDNSKLTVGSSTFQYNSAPNAPAAACGNCVLVAFGNTQYRNNGGTQDACAL